jgi:hypothetical protein
MLRQDGPGIYDIKNLPHDIATKNGVECEWRLHFTLDDNQIS